MIIFATGGHSKVVFSACAEEVTCFFDDFSENDSFISKPVFKYDKEIRGSEKIIIAIGDNFTRKKVAGEISHSFGIVTDDSALVDHTVKIGVGSQILQGTILQADTIVGQHTIINTGASIDHDSIIGDYCHIAPQVTLCGNVTVGEGTIIGAGSTVIPGITIGKWSKIGAGSVVTKNIPDNAIAVGNPARVIKS
ncbi:MAG: acetyltransferase [Bacteroidetes bacterium]|nr:MAG: acetyltransferase [Bacteroidota bacterium]